MSGEDKLKSLFAQTDRDGSQSLSKSEFGDLLEAACAESPYLSATLRSDDPVRLFHKYDKNGDGGIDVHEFRQLIDDMSHTHTHTHTHTRKQTHSTTLTDTLNHAHRQPDHIHTNTDTYTAQRHGLLALLE